MKPTSRSPTPPSISLAERASALVRLPSATRSALGFSTPKPAPPRVCPGAWSGSTSKSGRGGCRSSWTARMCRSISPRSCAISPARPIFPVPCVAVVALAADKDAKGFVAELARRAAALVFTDLPGSSKGPLAGRIAGARGVARRCERGRAGRQAGLSARRRAGDAGERLADGHRLALSHRRAARRGRRQRIWIKAFPIIRIVLSMMRAGRAGPGAAFRPRPERSHRPRGCGLRAAVRRRRIDGEFRRAALADLGDLDMTVGAQTDLRGWNATLDFANRFLLTVYDAAYVEFAQRLALPLATLNEDMRPPSARVETSRRRLIYRPLGLAGLGHNFAAGRNVEGHPPTGQTGSPSSPRLNLPAAVARADASAASVERGRHSGYGRRWRFDRP